MTRLLVIDDEPEIRRALSVNLSHRGYSVDTAATGADGVQSAATKAPDAVLLDLGLPDIDGLVVIERLRAFTDIPIIILSVRGAEADKVEALETGADDYVTKPFGMDEVVARIRVALRRRQANTDPAPIATPHFGLDFVSMTATLADGTVVRLTPIEWKIVIELAREPGRLVTQKALLKAVWGPAYERETNYLRVHLAAIRKKLEPNPARPRYFVTEVGVGYRFVGADDADHA